MIPTLAILAELTAMTLVAAGVLICRGIRKLAGRVRNHSKHHEGL